MTDEIDAPSSRPDLRDGVSEEISTLIDVTVECVLRVRRFEEDDEFERVLRNALNRIAALATIPRDEKSADGWSSLDTAPSLRDEGAPEQIWIVSPMFPEPALSEPLGNRWRIRRDLALSGGRSIPKDIPTHWLPFTKPLPPSSTHEGGDEATARQGGA